MNTFNRNNSFRFTLLLAGTLASAGALANPPTDAQGQARALLTPATLSRTTIPGHPVTESSRLDAQAQARLVFLAPLPTGAVNAGTASDSSPASDVQRQARAVLLAGTGKSDATPARRMAARR